MMAKTARERLDALLLRKATEGLDEAGEREMARLAAGEPEVDTNGYERAAAAICLAALGTGGKLPPALRLRLEERARKAFGE